MFVRSSIWPTVQLYLVVINVKLFYASVRRQSRQSYPGVHAGIPATQRILALQTPLHDVTCGGSGLKLSTHT